jgi:hypothetical protein
VNPARTLDPRTLNPRIDAYIAKSRPFAQPILNHIRELVHKACPGVVETIKWSRPFFEYKGVILANVSAFNEHCSFGFWGEEIAAVLRDAKLLQPEAMGSLGRLTHIEDLPADKQMLGLLRQAAAFIDSGQYTSPIAARNKVVKAPKPSVEAPPEFTRALKANKKSLRRFRCLQPQLQAGICRMDRRRQARGDTRQAHRHGHRVDQRRQTAQLEIPELLTSTAAPPCMDAGTRKTP